MNQPCEAGTSVEPSEQLLQLLVKACPPNDKEQKSILILAPHLGVSFQRIYKWVNNARIPARRVKDIVEVADGRVSMDDLLPYVI